MLSVESYPNLGEAARAMGGGARYLAGGTLVMRSVTYAEPGLERIVRARQVERTVAPDGAGLRIGAGATMADILGARDLDFLHPVARGVGGPAVRNMATLGGNLFAPNPYGDLAVALLALDAQAVMAGGQVQPLAALLGARDRPSGLVAAVTLARPETGSFRFRKVSRVKPKGVAMLSVAVRLGRGDPRVVFGNMGPVAMRVPAAERALAQGVSEAAIAAACAVCCEGLQPTDDALATAWYRREVAPVHLSRLLKEGPR